MFNFLKQSNNEVSEKDACLSMPDQESIPESPGPREQALQTQIVTLWKEIWEGLYQFHGREGPYHLDRLKELYFAAGMSASHIDKLPDGGLEQMNYSHGVLGLLGLALSRQDLRQLQLFDGLSISSLESVITLLEAYKRQIPAINEIYALLRSLGVGFRTPTPDDEKAVEQQYLPLADALAKQLLHLNARLAVLVSELRDENWEKHGDSQLRNGWLVSRRAFPLPRRQTKSGFGSKY